MGVTYLRCIYLDEENVCNAQPESVAMKYKPDEEELKTYCTHHSDFRACARLKAYHEYLEALQKKRK